MSEPDFFDRLVQSAAQEANDRAATPSLEDAVTDALPVQVRTPAPLRKAVQHVLANGWLDAESKPQLFRLISAQTAQVDALLEPLDLQVRVDDVRGLAFLVVVANEARALTEDEADDWTHPLMRRQRLTLEQSLMLAILRRLYLQHEQEQGIGRPVSVVVDSLLPQLESYLGPMGSDTQERKRLGQMLDNLRTHGMVSEVDAQGLVTIRPMIVHLMNPENLQLLLRHLREASAQDTGLAEQAGDHEVMP